MNPTLAAADTYRHFDESLPMKQAEIPAALNNLLDAMTGTEESIAVLHGRLAPVMALDEDKAGLSRDQLAGSGGLGNAALARELNALTGRLRQANERLHFVLDRLEL